MCSCSLISHFRLLAQTCQRLLVCGLGLTQLVFWGDWDILIWYIISFKHALCCEVHFFFFFLKWQIYNSGICSECLLVLYWTGSLCAICKMHTLTETCHHDTSDKLYWVRIHTQERRKYCWFTPKSSNFKSLYVDNVEKNIWWVNSAPPPPVLTLDFSPPPLPPADYAKGFGGKFGVETDKVDKSAVGFEYQGKTERHESQKGWYHHRHKNSPT